jgi:hypothetical protein
MDAAKKLFEQQEVPHSRRLLFRKYRRKLLWQRRPAAAHLAAAKKAVKAVRALISRRAF